MASKLPGVRAWGLRHRGIHGTLAFGTYGNRRTANVFAKNSANVVIRVRIVPEADLRALVEAVEERDALKAELDLLRGERTKLV